jgi:GH24 family phage-related lysozyme (muramidase)
LASLLPLLAIAAHRPDTGNLHPYPDPLTQAAPWTIGWGTAVYADGRPVGCPATISQTEADSLLASTVQLCLQPGHGFFGSSGFNTITACLRDKRWDDGAAALLLYLNPRSSVEAGLRRRRQAEGQLWQEGLAHLGDQEQQPDIQILEAIRPTLHKKENRDSTALTPQQQVAVEGDSRQLRRSQAPAFRITSISR